MEHNLRLLKKKNLYHKTPPLPHQEKCAHEFPPTNEKKSLGTVGRLAPPPEQTGKRAWERASKGAREGRARSPEDDERKPRGGGSRRNGPVTMTTWRKQPSPVSLAMTMAVTPFSYELFPLIRPGKRGEGRWKGGVKLHLFEKKTECSRALIRGGRKLSNLITQNVMLIHKTMPY